MHIFDNQILQKKRVDGGATVNLINSHEKNKLACRLLLVFFVSFFLLSFFHLIMFQNHGKQDFIK